MKLAVPRTVATMAKEICETGATRYALGCVQLEVTGAGRAVAVATDGRAAAYVEWHDPELQPADEPRLVPVEALKKVSVAAGKREVPLLIEAEKTLATVQADGSRHMADVAEGLRFPHVRDVLPPYMIGTRSITVDSGYLLKLAKVAQAHGCRAVTLTIRDDAECHERPLLLTGLPAEPNGSRLAALLMPMKGKNQPAFDPAEIYRRDKPVAPIATETLPADRAAVAGQIKPKKPRAARKKKAA